MRGNRKHCWFAHTLKLDAATPFLTSFRQTVLFQLGSPHWLTIRHFLPASQQVTPNRTRKRSNIKHPDRTRVYHNKMFSSKTDRMGMARESAYSRAQMFIFWILKSLLKACGPYAQSMGSNAGGCLQRKIFERGKMIWITSKIESVSRNDSVKAWLPDVRVALVRNEGWWSQQPKQLWWTDGDGSFCRPTAFTPSEMGEEEEGNYGAELEMGQGLEAEQLGRTPGKLNVDNGKSPGCD